MIHFPEVGDFAGRKKIVYLYFRQIHIFQQLEIKKCIRNLPES